MLSCISGAHAAEPGLKSASFWPESEPGSLVFSYFCLAWSMSQMKDIQSPDSLQQRAFWLLKTVISPTVAVATFAGFKVKFCKDRYSEPKIPFELKANSVRQILLTFYLEPTDLQIYFFNIGKPGF